MDDPRLTTPGSLYYGMHPLIGQERIDWLVAQATNDWQVQRQMKGSDYNRWVNAYAANGPFYEPREHTGMLIWGRNLSIVGVGGITRDQFVALSAEQKAKIEAFTGFPVA